MVPNHLLIATKCVRFINSLFIKTIQAIQSDFAGAEIAIYMALALMARWPDVASNQLAQHSTQKESTQAEPAVLLRQQSCECPR